MEIKWTRVLWEAATHEAWCSGETIRWETWGQSGSQSDQSFLLLWEFCVIWEQSLKFLCLLFSEWHWVPGNKDSGWMSAGRRVRSSHFIPSLLPIKGAITTNPHWATYDLCYLENRNMKTLETCYKCWSWSPCQESPYNGDYCSIRSVQQPNLL